MIDISNQHKAKKEFVMSFTRRVGDAPSSNTNHLLHTANGQPAHQTFRGAKPSTSTVHLTPSGMGQPSRQSTRIGNVATETFIRENPRAATVYRTMPRQEPTIILTSPTPKPRSHVVVKVGPNSSCWAKFVAFIALIFCCGLLSKPYRE